MLAIKDAGRQPPVVLLLACAANIAQDLGITLRVTETIGATHGSWSLHYSLRAIDLGTKEHPPDVVAAVMAEFERRLGLNHIDLIWEAKGTTNEHLHIEWDPAKVAGPLTLPPAGGSLSV